MRYRRTLSNCAKCPLRDRKQVRSICEIENPKVVLVGEAPGADEDTEGKPFVGPSGKLLRGMVYRCGIVFEQAWRMNVINCRPPGNRIDSPEAQVAIQCCKKGFEAELDELKAMGVKVIGALGATAAEALGVEGNITKVRGSVYQRDGLPVIPTYHPSYILRGNWSEETTWSSDFIKMKSLSLSKWKPPKEKFNLFPTLAEVEEFSKTCVAGKKLVGVDIEGFKQIMMIGLSVDGETAMVVPFIKKGGGRYWSPKEEPAVKAAVNNVLKFCPTLYQNAQFDVYAMESQGYTVGNVAHDTMLLHHAIHPELPHRLGYIVSVYGETPYWKDVVLKSDEVMWEQDDEVIRRYNARDAVVLHQVLPKLLKDLKEIGTEKTYYDFSLKLLRPLMSMRRNGINVDLARLKKAKAKFYKAATKTEAEIRKLCGLPEDFNLDSGDHMRLLLHGTMPSAAPKVREELAKYDTNPKLRRDTKKYRELVARDKVFTETKPLYKTSAKLRATESGSDPVDDEALIQIQRAAANRLDAIGCLVRRTAQHDEEEQGIKLLLKFIALWRTYQENHKLLTTYSKFDLGPDGRIHPQYKIHGTATGRLSSAEPNAQNLSERVLDVFTAGPGRAIVKADFSNIEYRMMAIVTGETWLEEQFNAGVNFHDINTKLLFGIEKGDPDWDRKRRIAKTFIFGLSYGGSVEGIYKQIITADPEFAMTMGQFRQVVADYFNKLPKYREWREKIQEQALATRIVETVFGRKRILLGTEDEITRQALNTPMQGSAGEVAELGIIGVYDAIAKNPKWEAKLICTVHDSILVECAEAQSMAVAAAMKDIMEREVVINGRQCRFPVDVEIGPSWGETEKVKIPEAGAGRRNNGRKRTVT